MEKTQEKVKLERIAINIVFPDDFEIQDYIVTAIKDMLQNEIDKSFDYYKIITYSSNITIEKKYRAIVLYEEEMFRIVTTKKTKALLQKKIKHNSESIRGYSWKDHAWFASGDQEHCIKLAKKEIIRLRGTGKRGRRGTRHKKDYLENMPKADKELLASIL